MKEDVERLVKNFTDQDMTKEGQASVLGYARGRLDAQREFTRKEKNLTDGKTNNVIKGGK